MKKVIIDTDCTIDVKGCDLDDAFAILFLIAHPDIEVKLITTTFGNNNEDVTYKATRSMLDDLNINIPLIKGGLYTNDAGEAIRNEVEKKQRYNYSFFRLNYKHSKSISSWHGC